MGRTWRSSQKKKDSWRTPPALYDLIAEIVDGIDLGPCAGPSGDRLELPGDAEPAADLPPTEIAKRNVMPWEDGLAVLWTGDMLVNLPFSDVDQWLATAIGAWMAGDAEHVFLRHGREHRDARVVPPLDRVVRFADVLHQPAAELHRPETGEFASGVSFNTTVSVFGEVPALLAAYWKGEGDLVVRPWNTGRFGLSRKTIDERSPARPSKGMDMLFPMADAHSCRVCNEHVEDGRQNYCSPRCKFCHHKKTAARNRAIDHESLNGIGS